MGSEVCNPTPDHERSDTFNVFSVTEVCLICLQKGDGGGIDSACTFEERVKKMTYQRFLEFCIQYLKVDVNTVNALITGGDRLTEKPPVGNIFFCSTCNQTITEVLRVFSEWTDLRVKLLGLVNELGLQICRTPNGQDEVTEDVCSFRDEVERKCFMKAQIVQPFVELNNVETTIPKEEVEISSWQLHAENINEDDNFTGIKIDTHHHKKEDDGSYGDNDCDFDETEYDLQDPAWSPPPTTGTIIGNVCPNSSNTQTRNILKRRITQGRTEITSCNDDSPNSDNEQPVLSSLRRSKRRTRKTTPPAKVQRPRYSYKCSECKIKIRKRAKFFEHSVTVHEGIDINKFLKCSVCQEKLGDILELQDHLKTKHELDDDKSIFCVLCPESFTTQQLSDLHRRMNHTVCPQLLCEVDGCTEKFMFVSDYNIHLLEAHLTCEGDPKVAYCCKKCGRGFRGSRQRELHQLYHIPKNDEGFHVCPFDGCEKYNKYRNVNKLIGHYNKCHFSEKDQLELYRCDQCKKSPFFIFQKDLLIHFKSHTKEVKCLFCNAIFQGHNALKVHHFNTHPNEFKGNLINAKRKTDTSAIDDSPPSKVPIDLCDSRSASAEITLHRTCPYCSKNFLTFRAMAKHKAAEHDIHLSIKPKKVQCDLCGLTICKGQLPRHMLCHKEPHLPCPYPPCTKKFRREENLTMHVKKVHDRKESDREFICDTCGKRYLSRGILNRHVKEQHMKLYSCHICSKAFSTAGRVNEHLRAAHSTEKFHCKWCPSEYGYLTKLKNHCKKKHPEQAHLVKQFYNYKMKPKNVQSNNEQPMEAARDSLSTSSPPVQTPT